jgi:hypothetical protein
VTVIKSKLGTVIDIMAETGGAGARIDMWPRKATRDDNQRWRFVPDPAGSGYFFITSPLDHRVISVAEGTRGAGAPLDALARKRVDYDNQLWGFVPDPAGSEYFFITSARDGSVMDVVGASQSAGAALDLWPQRTLSHDHQLWAAVDGSFPPPAQTGLAWGPVGTEAPPDSTTIGSGTNKCAYQARLSIQQDGSCTFSGYYQNRGHAALITAPTQQFSVTFVVFDSRDTAYSFAYSGSIPSAPRPGSLITWCQTQICPAIANNWFPIAARNSAEVFANNSTDVSFWDVLSSLPQTVANDVGTSVSQVETVMSLVEPLVRAAAPVGSRPAAIPGTPGAGTHGRSASGRIAGRGDVPNHRQLYSVG